jgi:hypothetical protein
MPKLKMELGAEPKKVAILGGLLLLGAYLFYSNVLSDPEPGGRAAQATTAQPKTGFGSQARKTQDALIPVGPKAAEKQRGPAGRSEFKPTLKPKEAPDPISLDPSLRLDILQKLASATVAGGHRSLFDFGPVQRAEDVVKKQPEPKIVVKKRMIGPELPPPPQPPPPPPVKPPPPAISLKFYGNSLPPRNGVKRVFCIDGDEIHVPAEGEVIKKRYRIVKINVGSVVVEDIEYKNQQTLKIEEPPKAG